MKKKFIIAAFLMGGLLTGCNSDEIDNLQSQVEELTQKLNDSEQAQQDELTAQIAALQEVISSLEGELDGKDTSLQEALEALQEAVEGNKENIGAIHFGNVASEAEYDALVASGASIVTGKVVVTDASHAGKLANVTFVGGDLELAVAEEITASLNVTGDIVLLDGFEGALTLSGLKTVSGGLKIMTPDVTAVQADQLMSMVGEFRVEGKDFGLTDISFASLSSLGSLYLDYNATSSGGGIGIGGGDAEIALNLNEATIHGDAEFHKFFGTLTLGMVEGNLTIMNFQGPAINLNGNLSGDLTVERFDPQNDNDASDNDYSSQPYVLEGAVGEFVLGGTLTRIEGDILIRNNAIRGDRDAETGIHMPKGLTGINLDALTYIGGSLQVHNNGALEELDAFNAVTEVAGYYIEFKNNGVFNARTYETSDDYFINNGLTSLSVLNALTTVSISGRFTIEEKADVLSVGNALPLANYVTLKIKATDHTDASSLIESFQLLETSNNTLEIDVTELPEGATFSSFNAYSHIKDYKQLKVYASSSSNLCSMNTFFDKIQADYDPTQSYKFKPAAENESGVIRDYSVKLYIDGVQQKEGDETSMMDFFSVVTSSCQG